MKKHLILFASVVVILFGTFLTDASAASAAYREVNLSSSETTDTTSRLTFSSGKLYVTVSNYWYSGDTVKYTIFKNGNAYVTGTVGRNSTTSYSRSISQWGSGEYSLRLYCGVYSPYDTGCSAKGTLQTK